MIDWRAILLAFVITMLVFAASYLLEKIFENK